MKPQGNDLKNKQHKFNNKLSDDQNKRNKIKFRIMSKYNVSSEEAEKILSKIEQKENNKPDKNKNLKNIKNNKNSKTNSTNNLILNSTKNQEKNQNNNKNEDKLKNQNINSNKNNNKQSNNQNNTTPHNSINSQNYKNKPQKDKNTGKVDSILEDILPDYNKQISIKLEHVDLTFEVKNEKVDTLKESFIRTIKGEKSKKIKIHALKDVSLEIYKGEKVGIIGYNGAGKSTLLNVITGIYLPDKGNVVTHGKISPLLSLGAGFDYNFSGRRNIILNGAVLGYDRQYLESKIDEIIEFSELGEYIDIPIKNYSSGMMAKLGFSIATSVNPDILIIDEILGVGDVSFHKKSADKIKSLMDGNTTVILVSHSIPQIRELCDKAIWIDNGYVRDIGEVNKICDKYLKDSEKASNKQLKNIQLS